MYQKQLSGAGKEFFAKFPKLHYSLYHTKHAELEEMTPEKANMVNASTDIYVIDLKTRIMNKVFEGK